METKENFVELLVERTEEYGRTSFELLKLRSVDKMAKVSASLVSRVLLIIVVTLLTLTLNIAIALWIGDLLGKSYYGFLIVTAFYVLLAILLVCFSQQIKTRVYNSIVTQILN